MSISKNDHLMKHINSILIDLPSPSNMNYFWNFGSLLGLCFAIQLVTGIFLAMHYCGDMILVFKSMVHMCSECMASLFFVCVYIHMGKILCYGSYQKKPIWFLGMIMFMVTMITAFMIYELPWGQMSFWGGYCYHKFFICSSMLGDDMVQWIWGGFSVNNATLGSFFSLHYLFPFVLASLILIHMVLIHSVGSSNPLGINNNFDKVLFHWYFAKKGMYGFLYWYLFYYL